MRYDLVIFDLDGTVLNTLEDLAFAVNTAMERAGCPTLAPEEVRKRIGGGVTRLIRLALPEGASDELRQRALTDFKACYFENCDVHTRPYPGIPRLLTELRSAGVKAAVNSNKLDAASRALCDAHFPGLLDAVLGERPEIPKKPDPEGALRLMAALGARPERTLYVGDSDTDILTAKNAGIDGAWVSWGYRRRDELPGLDIPRAFDTVEELRAFLLG